MRLSSTLILSLLAFNNVSSAFKQTTSIERRMRMLQKKEVGGTSSSPPPRKLSKGSEKKGGNKSSRSGDKGKDKKGRKKDDDTKKGVNGRYDGKDSKKSHTSHLDANDSGISTDSTEYTYGTPINVSFDLTEDIVIGDAGTSGRRLDGLDVNTLKVGLFMRMANPQDGALEPIMQVTPTIVAGDESDTSTTAPGGRRMLKGTRKKGGDKKKKGDDKKKGGPTTPDPEPPTTTINLSGTATFTTTDIVSLDPSIYGVGFDAYLLDENGAAIIGPTTFYEEKSQEMIEQAAAEVAIKMAEQAESAIVKYNPTKMKHKGGKKEDVAMMAQAMGIGSGKDGESMIIATTERLADYRLDTDAMYYVNGDDITATFDIHQDVVSDSGRMLKKKPWGNKKKKKKNKKKNKKPKPTTTTTIATTSATKAPDTTQAPPDTTQAPDTTTTESPPQTTSTVGSTTSESPPQTTDAPEEESTTSQATVVTTASTTTVISTDGSTQAAPEAPDTTSTEAPPEIDMAADDADDETSEDDEMEDEVEIDADDVRLFSLGIFMRMANPQDGKLSPIHYIPFCPNPEECNKKSDELESGTFQFSSLELNMEENGSGYDVWVLNGRGEGVAGPHTFYVEKEAALN